MEKSQKLAKRYDHVLIGYNLASISFAFELTKKGENFCLLDSKHFGSSPFKFIPGVDKDVYARVPFNTYSEDLVEPIANELDTSLSVEEGTPITFDKGQFKSFLGFGDKKIQEIDILSRYCETQSLKAETTPEELWAAMEAEISPYVFLDQQITDLEHNDGSVQQITLNGKTHLQGSQFYFFDHFPFLIDQISSNIKKLASQFAKARWYSSVNLIIHHKQAPENFELDQLYLLMGSKEQACLGKFSRIGEELISRWESFFPSELTADSETTGTLYKEIKKQVKRAFSGDSEAASPEHILIQNHVYADLGKTDLENGLVKNFNNLHLYSPLLSSHMGWLFEKWIGLNAATNTESPEKSAPENTNEVAAPGTPC